MIGLKGESAFLHELNGGYSGYWTRFLWRKRFERTITLRSKLCYFDEVHGSIVADAGFISDGASVPRVLWSIYPPMGEYLRAAIIHDFLCVEGKAGRGRMSSVEAAAVFYRAMLAEGVSSGKAWRMWKAVRFGGPRWKAAKLTTNQKD